MFVLNKKRCALFLDMGFGKTAVCMTTLLSLINQFKATRWLVIAPLRVARDTWPDEVNEWQHLTKLKVRAAVGTAKQRSEALLDKTADIVAINIENVGWLEQWAKDNRCSTRFPFDGIIIDESSKFKDPSTKRWRSARRLSLKVEYFVELTGTPRPEGMHNLYGQIALIDGGERLGDSYGDYLRNHFDHNPYEQKYTIKQGHEEIIMRKIADICMVPDPEDYVELPESIIVPTYVNLNSTELEAYRTLERDYILEITPDAVIEAISAAALSTKLLQLANGCVYQNTEDERKIPHVIHDAKLRALEEIVDEAEGMPILVAYTYKTDVKRIQERFPKAVVFDRKDETIKARWNRREIPMLLVSPKSAAHGLNIQKGSNLLVWFGLVYSCEQWDQLIKRLVRPGQDEPSVFIRPLIARGTIDEVAYSSVTRKSSEQTAFLSELRSYTKARLAA